MNSGSALTSQLAHLISVLKPYSDFWSAEVIEQHRHFHTLYPSEWISSLEQLSEDQLFELERHRDLSRVRSVDFMISIAASRPPPGLGMRRCEIT